MFKENEEDMGLKKGWKRVKLGEMIEIEMGQSPKSEYYNNDGKGLPFLQGNRTFGDRFPYYDTFCTNNKKIAKKNSVIMSVRAPVGDLNLIDCDVSIGRGVCALNNKNGENLFLYYLMKNNIKKLINKESGTVFGSVNKNDILGLEINLPPLETQQKIASILSSLDDKIELNNEMNKTLEEMAQTLFKRWFIDFEFPNENGEPYKSSGGKMVESELGEIPEGWKIINMEEVFKFVKGKKPKTISEFYSKETPLKYLTINGFSGNENFYASADKTILVDKEDIVMVMDGASSGNIYIGKKGILGSTFSKIEKIKELNWCYLYLILKYYESDIKSHTTGSAIPHTDKRYVEKIKTSIPFNINLLNILSKKLTKLIEQIILNQEEIQTLTVMRDILLPKLMNGNIEV